MAAANVTSDEGGGNPRGTIRTISAHSSRDWCSSCSHPAEEMRLLGLQLDWQHHLQLDLSRATELRYSWAAANHTGDIAIKVDMVFTLY